MGPSGHRCFTAARPASAPGFELPAHHPRRRRRAGHGLMKDGAVMEAGSVDDVLTRPREAYTRELVEGAG